MHALLSPHTTSMMQLLLLFPFYMQEKSHREAKEFDEASIQPWSI
jgi:hypothetical protein